MALDWLVDDPEQYVSRGQRILSVLDGSGSVEVLPGRPDVEATSSDFDKGEKFNPEIDFDVNAFSRFDKFDGLEFGQEVIDRGIESASKSAIDGSGGDTSEEK